MIGSPGVFVVFEGGEGAGKSTQVRLLRDALAADGREVVLTREPGGTRAAEAIRALVESNSLTGGQAAAALEAIMTGAATPAQIGAFLAGLRMRGETPEIIAACLEVTQRHAESVPVEDVIDIVGTGGDGIGLIVDGKHDDALDI